MEESDKMAKKRGGYYRRPNLALAGIIIAIALILFFIALPPEYKYSLNPNNPNNPRNIFRQEFVKDDFNVINGSEIKFSGMGIEVEDFLLVNGRAYRIDREKIEDILIRKESANGGKKIIYGLRNDGGEKELQFVWRSRIPGFYDRADDFNLSRDFVCDTSLIRLYSDNVYRAYITFEDVRESFGGVSLSYNAEARTLVASSNKIKLNKKQELIMDPGVGIDEIPPLAGFTFPTPADGLITDKTSAEINITIEEENLNRFIWSWDRKNHTFHISSLVLMLNFDNLAGLGENNVYARDLSRYGNNGIIHGAVYSEGRYGSALEFDEGDYVSVEENSNFDLEPFTIEFLFKPNVDYDSASGYASLIHRDTYGIYIENGKMVFEYKGNKVYSSTSLWSREQWYSVVATYDGVQTIYVNGLKENSAIADAPFTLKNRKGENIAFFLNSGDIVLRGSCKTGLGACTSPPSDGFAVQNSESRNTAYIDNSGNLCIEDTDCKGNDESCDEPGEGSFAIEDTDGRIVSYIDTSGRLCSRGDLIENGIP